VIRTKICMLHLAAGAVESCPGGACPFWEEGGAALEPGCGLERLGLELDRPDLALYLLELRSMLEAARSMSEREAARRAFGSLIPPDLSGR
jgi:hypothetical protein